MSKTTHTQKKKINCVTKFFFSVLVISSGNFEFQVLKSNRLKKRKSR